MRILTPLTALSIVILPAVCHSASITVAAANSSAKAKAKADIVCTGKADQVKLLESIAKAGKFEITIDRADGGGMMKVECIGKHSVEWLPGDYYLSSTLAIPNASDLQIEAEGTVFHYRPKTGDTVLINGVNRCRYRLGMVQTASSGAAIRVKPSAKMPCFTSIISFTGLSGSKAGTGLCLDPSLESLCNNQFEGTDISGFTKGVLILDAAKKCDANWFWLNYIRNCATCVWELGKRVGSNDYFVNAEASLPGFTAVRTAGRDGKWQIIMRTVGKNSRSLVLDPGASRNVIEVHPPLTKEAPLVNQSGNDTNVVLCAGTPPFVQGDGGPGPGVGKVSGDR